MTPVERVSDWGEWDALDGKRLESGEMVRVTWPDGTVSGPLVVSIDARVMCTRENVVFSRASGITELRGAVALVALRGLLAERVAKPGRRINRELAP